MAASAAGLRIDRNADGRFSARTQRLALDAKLRVAAGIESASIHADSRQAEFCTYLSAILLGGSLLKAPFGWWWADPVAGLIMAPIIARESVASLQGKTRGHCGCR